MLQHCRASPFGFEDTATTTSAHLRWCIVKNTPIEDFYQRMVQNGKEKASGSRRAGCPEVRVDRSV
jgi:hypothetical protein